MRRNWFVPLVVAGVIVAGLALRENFGVNLSSPWLLTIGGGGLVVAAVVEFLTRSKSH